MARFEMEGLEKLIFDYNYLAKFRDEIDEKMLNAGADVLVKAQRERAIDYDVWDPDSSVHLANSIQKTVVKFGTRGREGLSHRVIYVYPQGERIRNGVITQNAEIAFVAEFGRPGSNGKGAIAPRPFIRDANEDAYENVLSTMSHVNDEELEKLDL